MKISTKIFVFTYCLIMIFTILGGFLLIHCEYENNLAQAKTIALDNNKTMYTYISATGDMLGSTSAQYSLAQFIQRLDLDGNEVLLGEASELQEDITLGNAADLENEQYCYAFVSKDGSTFIQVVSKYKTQYIINYHGISNIIQQRNQNYQLYRNIIICTSVIIAAVLYLFSWYITRPLAKVTKMAEKLSTGDYSVRIDSSYTQMKSMEVEQLGNTLNHMADHLETYIEEIQLTAQRKEDFVGNFTHELKTPMTSIIGYADLLRTYNLLPDKQREYSNYIYIEAKRIEQLAANLLQLIVMQKEQFPFEQFSVTELFEQLQKDTRFLGEKYDVRIQFDFESGTISGERSLLIVAIKNVIDNACKASAKDSTVTVYGRNHSNGYEILVKDFGCGIPESELDNILEPFYMVDKSRTRKQGGAGLGLSLTKQITQIHGGDIHILSKPQKGTMVRLTFHNKETGGCENEH